jgi:two-component system chemotaxis response regulator CheY
MQPTALIIDDSPVSRAILRRGLLKAGVHVVAEEMGGERALELYESLCPTLIFLDIVLPGIDGVTAALEILAKHPEAKIVICSALTDREKILACRQAGVVQFMLKPFSIEKIAQLAEALTKRSFLAPKQEARIAGTAVAASAA